MSNKFFCVSSESYDLNKHFYIYRPSSLDNPKNNSVMFILESNMHKVDSFKNVKECLIYWPNTKEHPDWIDSSNIVINVLDPRLEYCKFFKDNDLMNLPVKEDVNFQEGYFISNNTKIGMNNTIMPMAYIGGDVSIGNNVYIGTGTKIVGKVTIGDNVIIRENTVIGADGLTTDRDSNMRALTMPQYGGVIIQDRVQIGSNSIIARGAIDDTIIQAGSKIDNSVFISHNVNIGENTFIVGETIMFGSSSTKNNVLISGNSTIRNGVCIGENSIVGMGSVVTKSCNANSVLLGNPAKVKGEK